MNDIEQRILKYYQSRPDDPPTVREVMAACQISSTSVAAHHINAMVAAGNLERFGGNGRARGVRLANSDVARLRLRVAFLEAKVRDLENQLRTAAR